jgi:hypothetical protein
VREAQFRRLNADGGCHTHGDWYATDCPIEIGLDPEIEEGQKSNLKCGDGIKNTVRTDDQLTGMTVKFSMGCRNPEIEFIIAGSVGTITYDASSPPCAIGYCPPTLAEQENAYPFEMKIYRAEKEGSNDVGFEEIHIYQCLPAFVTIGGSQEEYSTQEWTIAAVENPSYDPIGKPVYCWLIVNAIPT